MIEKYIQDFANMNQIPLALNQPDIDFTIDLVMFEKHHQAVKESSR